MSFSKILLVLIVSLVSVSAQLGQETCQTEGGPCGTNGKDSGKPCCGALVCSDKKCSTSGSSGDPHFIGLDGSAYDFQGVSGLHFNLVSEPESQMNALFHNLNMDSMGEATFIKAVGFQHIPSNHRVTVDAGLDDCVSGVPAAHTLQIRVDDAPAVSKAQLYTITHPAVNGTLLQLLKDKAMTVDYRASHGAEASEHITVRTDRLMYTIHRHAGACHLDIDMAILDPALLSESASTMHGVLGQTARWVGATSGSGTLLGDESDYVESGLLSHESKFAMVGNTVVGKHQAHSRKALEESVVAQAFVTY